MCSEQLTICGRDVQVSYSKYDKDRSDPILSNDDYNLVSGLNSPSLRESVAISYRGSYDLMDLMDSNFAIFKVTKKQRNFLNYICDLLYEQMTQDAKISADESVKNHKTRLNIAYFALLIAMLCPFVSLIIGTMVSSITPSSLFMRGSTGTLAIALCVEVLIAKYNVGSNDSLLVNKYIHLTLSRRHQASHLVILTIIALATLMTGFGDSIYEAVFPPYNPTLILT